MPEQLVLRKGDKILARDLRPARRARDRMRGLLGSDGLPTGTGILLEPARQVHTFGMRYPIDVVFCDASWRVLRVARSLAPNRITRLVLKARLAIELPKGAAEQVQIGDLLSVDQSAASIR